MNFRLSFAFVAVAALAPFASPALADGLPAAQLKDPKLLKEMLDASTKGLSPDEILAGSITDKAWNVEQNALGVAKRRTIHAAIAVKQKSGKCRVFDILFEQSAAGPKKFNATAFGGVGGSSEVACDSIKK